MWKAGEEREYKFLLDERQYDALWKRLHGGSSVRLQDNLFFDYQEMLLKRRWALRLRLEGRPEADTSDPKHAASLYDLSIRYESAAITVKGPVSRADRAMIRPELEAAIPVDDARRIRESGRLAIENLPHDVLEVLDQVLKGRERPREFAVWASFRNLRLLGTIAEPHPGFDRLRAPNGGVGLHQQLSPLNCLLRPPCPRRSRPVSGQRSGFCNSALHKMKAPGGFIEIALDRAETPDGKRRHELEIETSGDVDARTQELMADMGCDSLTPADVGKLVWAANLDKRIDAG